MKKIVVATLKASWALCCICVLAVTLYLYAPHAESDIGIFLVYGMLFLSFPVSLFVTALFTALVVIQESLNVPLLDFIGSNYLGFSVMWAIFFGCGYWQWFVLTPWLWRKWADRRQSQ